MEQQINPVVRLQALIAQARQRRGLPVNDAEAWAEGPEQALARLTAPTGGCGCEVPCDSSARRRRHLIAQINLKAKHYNLREEITAFVYGAERCVLAELETDQLEGVHQWLEQCIDDMEYACDSRYAPPAR